MTTPLIEDIQETLSLVSIMRHQYTSYDLDTDISDKVINLLNDSDDFLNTLLARITSLSFNKMSLEDIK